MLPKYCQNFWSHLDDRTKTVPSLLAASFLSNNQNFGAPIPKFHFLAKGFMGLILLINNCTSWELFQAFFEPCCAIGLHFRRSNIHTGHIWELNFILMIKILGPLFREFGKTYRSSKVCPWNHVQFSFDLYGPVVWFNKV